MVFPTDAKWVQSIGQLHGTCMTLYPKHFDQSHSGIHVKEDV